jgi:hypothetical protein
VTAVFDDLKPGMFFVYRGPRRWLFFPSAGAGQIIGLEPQHGVVHVRLYWPAAANAGEEERLEVTVGHLPILWSCFEGSLRELMDVGPVPVDARPSLLAWRERRARGEVGAFDVPLWRALRYAWETLLDSHGLEASHEPAAPSPETVVIEWAFPKRGATGDFNVVEVSATERAGC